MEHFGVWVGRGCEVVGWRDIVGRGGGGVLRKNIRKWVVVGDKKLDKYTRM